MATDPGFFDAVNHENHRNHDIVVDISVRNTNSDLKNCRDDNGTRSTIAGGTYIDTEDARCGSRGDVILTARTTHGTELEGKPNPAVTVQSVEDLENSMPMARHPDNTNVRLATYSEDVNITEGGGQATGAGGNASDSDKERTSRMSATNHDRSWQRSLADRRKARVQSRRAKLKKRLLNAEQITYLDKLKLKNQRRGMMEEDFRSRAVEEETKSNLARERRHMLQEETEDVRRLISELRIYLRLHHISVSTPGQSGKERLKILRERKRDHEWRVRRALVATENLHRRPEVKKGLNQDKLTLLSRRPTYYLEKCIKSLNFSLAANQIRSGAPSHYRVGDVSFQPSEKQSWKRMSPLRTIEPRQKNERGFNGGRKSENKDKTKAYLSSFHEQNQSPAEVNQTGREQQLVSREQEKGEGDEVEDSLRSRCFQTPSSTVVELASSRMALKYRKLESKTDQWLGGHLRREKEEESRGWTALTRAAAVGDVQGIQELVEAGCGLNDTNSKNETPLMCAVRFGKVEAVEALLGAGADPNAVSGGRNAVLYCVRYGFTHCLRSLLAKGASASALPELETSPMTLAIQKRRYIQALLLAHHGGSVLQAGRDEQSPVDEARSDPFFYDLVLNRKKLEECELKEREAQQARDAGRQEAAEEEKKREQRRKNRSRCDRTSNEDAGAPVSEFKSQARRSLSDRARHRKDLHAEKMCDLWQKKVERERGTFSKFCIDVSAQIAEEEDLVEDLIYHCRWEEALDEIKRLRVCIEHMSCRGEQFVFQALRKQDKDGVRALIEAGASLNTPREKDGLTGFLYACAHCDQWFVEFLMDTFYVDFGMSTDRGEKAGKFTFMRGMRELAGLIWKRLEDGEINTSAAQLCVSDFLEEEDGGASTDEAAKVESTEIHSAEASAGDALRTEDGKSRAKNGDVEDSIRKTCMENSRSLLNSSGENGGVTERSSDHVSGVPISLSQLKSCDSLESNSDDSDTEAQRMNELHKRIEHLSIWIDEANLEADFRKKERDLSHYLRRKKKLELRDYELRRIKNRMSEEDVLTIRQWARAIGFEPLLQVCVQLKKLRQTFAEDVAEQTQRMMIRRITVPEEFSDRLYSPEKVIQTQEDGEDKVVGVEGLYFSCHAFCMNNLSKEIVGATGLGRQSQSLHSSQASVKEKTESESTTVNRDETFPDRNVNEVGDKKSEQNGGPKPGSSSKKRRNAISKTAEELYQELYTQKREQTELMYNVVTGTFEKLVKAEERPNEETRLMEREDNPYLCFWCKHAQKYSSLSRLLMVNIRPLAPLHLLRWTTVRDLEEKLQKQTCVDPSTFDMTEAEAYKRILARIPASVLFGSGSDGDNEQPRLY